MRAVLPAPFRLTRLTEPSPLARLEALAAAGGLGALTLAMALAHVRRGGLYFDDWTVLSQVRFPAPGSGALGSLWPWYGSRPGQVAWYALQATVLGYHAHVQAAFAAFALAAEAFAVYALLRRLSLGPLHAGMVCALLVTFPFDDSVWLWPAASLAAVTIGLGAAGVLLALAALPRSGWPAWWRHAASLALFVWGILSYELLAVATCLVGLVYVGRVGWRRARWRWGADVLAVAATLAVAKLVLPTDIATPSHTQTLPGAIAHAAAIGAAGARVVGTAAIPLGGAAAWVALGLLVLIHAASLISGRPERTGAAVARTLRRWRTVAAAGVLVALAGWAAYVPAPAHYTPAGVGTVNRVNAVAAIGIALLLYGSLATLGALGAWLVHRRRPGRAAATVARSAAACAALASAALAGAYLQRTARDSAIWDRAGAAQRALLADVHAALPDPPADATLYAVDAPTHVGPVPILGTAVDLTGALRLSYGSGRLSGVPLLGGGSLACRSRSLTVHAAAAGASAASAYGTSFLVDVNARQAVRVADRRRCEQVARSLRAGESTPAAARRSGALA